MSDTEKAAGSPYKTGPEAPISRHQFDNMSDDRRTLRSGTKYKAVSDTESLESDAETAGSDMQIASPNPTTEEASGDPAIGDHGLHLYQLAEFCLDDSDDDTDSPEKLTALREQFGFSGASDREGTEGESSTSHLRPDPTRWTAASFMPENLRHRWRSLESSENTMPRTKKRYTATCDLCEETYEGRNASGWNDAKTAQIKTVKRVRTTRAMIDLG